MKCLICGKESPRISFHLRSEHNLDTKDYIVQYKYNGIEPTCQLEECSNLCRWDSNRTDFLKTCCYEHGQILKGKNSWDTLKSKPDKYKEVCNIRSKDAKKQYSKMTSEEKYKFHRSGYDAVGNLSSLGGNALKLINPDHFSEISNKFWNRLSDDEKEQHLRKCINSHRANYSFDTGTKVFENLQGYEVRVLKDLLKVYSENDIVSQPPAIRSEKKFYFPDFLIKSTNTVVEVKSRYYLQFDDTLDIKEQICLNAGYSFRLIVIE